MIKEPPLLTINRNFQRPDSAIIDALKGSMTGHIVDAQYGRGALDYRIKPIEAEKHAICGAALTVKAAPGDNLAALAALDLAQPGDVVVIATDAFLGTAVIGDLVVGMMANKGVTGVVTDGLVRDLVGLRGIPTPVFARGISPNSPTGGGLGSVGLPIVIGDVSIESGDLVIGDEDGIVVVPQADIPNVRAALKEVKTLETDLEAKVKNGFASPLDVEAMKADGRWQEV